MQPAKYMLSVDNNKRLITTLINVSEMEKISFFKRLDLVLQTLAVVIPIIICIVDEPLWIIVIYFTLGVVQLPSFLLHYFAKGEWVLQQNRKSYGITLLIMGTLVLVFTLAGAATVGIVLLCFISPFMAIFYTYTCREELKNLKNENE